MTAYIWSARPSNYRTFASIRLAKPKEIFLINLDKHWVTIVSIITRCKKNTNIWFYKKNVFLLSKLAVQDYCVSNAFFNKKILQYIFAF